MGLCILIVQVPEISAAQTEDVKTNAHKAVRNNTFFIIIFSFTKMLLLKSHTNKIPNPDIFSKNNNLFSVTELYEEQQFMSRKEEMHLWSARLN
jgi:hypothetical protein